MCTTDAIEDKSFNDNKEANKLKNDKVKNCSIEDKAMKLISDEVNTELSKWTICNRLFV